MFLEALIIAVRFAGKTRREKIETKQQNSQNPWSWKFIQISLLTWVVTLRFRRKKVEFLGVEL